MRPRVSEATSTVLGGPLGKRDKSRWLETDIGLRTYLVTRVNKQSQPRA